MADKESKNNEKPNPIPVKVTTEFRRVNYHHPLPESSGRFIKDESPLSRDRNGKDNPIPVKPITEETHVRIHDHERRNRNEENNKEERDNKIPQR